MRPIERAISTAGGVAFGAVVDDLMLIAKPGVVVAGEMLDWEAPTMPGYLLQASFATGVAAARQERPASARRQLRASARRALAAMASSGQGSTVTRRIWRRWPG